MTDIYKQHQAAFANVSAYVVMKDGDRVATIAFKFPRDGAGRLYAYVHWIGIGMVRGFAGGYGYDKRSAAVASSAQKMRHPAADDAQPSALRMDELRAFNRFVVAISDDSGRHWDDRLRDAGFTVWQAV